MKNTFYAVLCCLGSQLSYGQQNLEKYISYGLNNNESIRTQQFTLKKSVYALGEAKSQFFPDVSFNTTYTKAGGARSISLPLGHLVKPLYTTFNQRTTSNPFPLIINQR